MLIQAIKVVYCKERKWTIEIGNRKFLFFFKSWKGSKDSRPSSLSVLSSGKSLCVPKIAYMQYPWVAWGTELKLSGSVGVKKRGRVKKIKFSSEVRRRVKQFSSLIKRIKDKKIFLTIKDPMEFIIYVRLSSEIN